MLFKGLNGRINFPFGYFLFGYFPFGYLPRLPEVCQQQRWKGLLTSVFVRSKRIKALPTPLFAFPCLPPTNEVGLPTTNFVGSFVVALLPTRPFTEQGFAFRPAVTGRVGSKATTKLAKPPTNEVGLPPTNEVGKAKVCFARVGSTTKLGANPYFASFPTSLVGSGERVPALKRLQILKKAHQERLKYIINHSGNLPVPLLIAKLNREIRYWLNGIYGSTILMLRDKESLLCPKAINPQLRNKTYWSCLPPTNEVGFASHPFACLPPVAKQGLPPVAKGLAPLNLNREGLHKPNLIKCKDVNRSKTDVPKNFGFAFLPEVAKATPVCFPIYGKDWLRYPASVSFPSEGKATAVRSKANPQFTSVYSRPLLTSSLPLRGRSWVTSGSKGFISRPTNEVAKVANPSFGSVSCVGTKTESFALVLFAGRKATNEVEKVCCARFASLAGLRSRPTQAKPPVGVARFGLLRRPTKLSKLFVVQTQQAKIFLRFLLPPVAKRFAGVGSKATTKLAVELKIKRTRSKPSFPLLSTKWKGSERNGIDSTIKARKNNCCASLGLFSLAPLPEVRFARVGSKATTKLAFPEGKQTPGSQCNISKHQLFSIKIKAKGAFSELYNKSDQNQEITGFLNRHSSLSTNKDLKKMTFYLNNLLWHWSQRRHNKKSNTWIFNNYWQFRNNQPHFNFYDKTRTYFLLSYI